jgi:hypothetical protein
VKALVTLLALMLALGCAVGQQLVSPHDPYRLYRQTRLAPTLEERLAAGNRYLHVAPNGVYASEVRKWFQGTERAYLVRAHDQLPMLLAYAKGLPDGPSIQAVASRVEELEAAGRFVAGREAARSERVESLEAGLERAAGQRKAFVLDLAGWIEALVSVRSYRQPLAALPADVSARFAIGDAAAGCPLDVCAQSSSPRFAIPHASSQLLPREAPYTAELSLASGLLVGARLHGRELFSRIGEALDLTPVSFDDPQARAEAIGRALSVVGNALGATLAADGCERPAVSPVVLERECDGIHVTVTAAIDPGKDDEIAFSPAAPAPPSVPTAPAPRAPRSHGAPSTH